MASEVLLEISQNDVERAKAMSRKKFMMDRQSDMITSRKIGFAEGLQHSVKLMFQKGFSVETIAKTLDISEKDVNDILGKK